MQSGLHTFNPAESAFPSPPTTAHPGNAPAGPTLDKLIGDVPTAGGFAALLEAYEVLGVARIDRFIAVG